MAHVGKHFTISPPVILAIETSGMCGGAALTADGHCIAEYSLQSKLTHSRRLLTGIDWLLKEASISWEEIDGLAVSLGPGSFTGLRIGLSTAKGLAMATGKPLLGVSTLDGLAVQLSHQPHLICPVIDARKKEVYTALYRCNADGSPRRVSDYMVVSPQALAELITEPTVLLGDGIAAYGDFFKETLGERALMAPAATHFARSAAIGMLGVELWKRNEFLDPATAVPLYIRQSEAELLFGQAGKR